MEIYDIRMEIYDTRPGSDHRTLSAAVLVDLHLWKVIVTMSWMCVNSCATVKHLQMFDG